MNIEELHYRLPEHLSAQITDKIQFFLRANADQQMRLVIFLGQQINFEVLKKAFRLAIYSEPVFSCFYKEEKNNAYWQKQEVIDSSLLVDLVESERDQETEIDSFLTMEILPFSFPIVKAKIIRNSHKDILCINMNHTPTDGGGLKEFVKIVASIYTNLMSNPEYEVKANIYGDRSLKTVMDSFTIFQKLRFAKEGFQSPRKGMTWSFDWNKTDSDKQKYIIRTKITSDTFDKIKAYGKVYNATINDVVLAAFIRAFIPTSKWNSYAAKPVIIPFDLRKYLRPAGKTAICSLTGSLVCNIGKECGDTFNETLCKVRDEMNRKKMMHAEMNMITRIAVLSKFIKYDNLREQLMNRKMRPIPLVTNVGIISSEDINFNGVPVEDAYVTGAISLGDYFTMGYSTFQNRTTFSVGFIGGEIQYQKVNCFLNCFITELEKI